MPSDERIAALGAAREQNIAEERHPYIGMRIQTLYELLWILKWHGWLGEEEYAYEPQYEYDRGPKIVRANWSGADLHNVDLTGISLIGANLTEVNLRGADLSEAILKDATLTNAYLEDACLNVASLQHAKLTRASLV